MGKKSKAAKAKAKVGVGDGSLGPKGGGGTGGGTSAGAMVTSSGGNKKQNCVRCFGTVKADKGSACPGCSLLYCWRCEKKAFEECPNGSNCVHLCVENRTFFRVLEEKEGLTWLNFRDLAFGDSRTFGQAFARFQQYIEQDETLSIDANACAKCPDCEVRECFRCQRDPTHRRILSCGSCGTTRCAACSRGILDAMLDNAEAFDSIFQCCMRSSLEEDSLSSEVVRDLSTVLRETSGNAIIRCKTSTCNFSCCVACADDQTIASAVKWLFPHAPRSTFKCSRCYWSTKPCTNPTCPNEVGVPTKRCGGCHLDRYCSVECQLAAYPAHVNRCSRIQEKRAAFAAAAAQVEKEGQGGD